MVYKCIVILICIMLFDIGLCECILRFEMHVICINVLLIQWYV